MEQHRKESAHKYPANISSIKCSTLHNQNKSSDQYFFELQNHNSLSSAIISYNRLDPIKLCFSSLSNSLQSKLSSSVLDSSALTYQQLWKNFSSFISEYYKNNKFPYLLVIDSFESLIAARQLFTFP